MDNLSPQTLKSRLLIPNYDSSDTSGEDVVHKKYVDSKNIYFGCIKSNEK